MKNHANLIDNYIQSLPAERKEAITNLRKVILANLPSGFVETIASGMIGYVVPLDAYPKGYLNNPLQPLPFMNLASQKNFIALYHMGMYADKALLEWFTAQYALQVKSKLDMGKSCIRFKKLDQIPYALIGELAGKITLHKWITTYEELMQKR